MPTAVALPPPITVALPSDRVWATPMLRASMSSRPVVSTVPVLSTMASVLFSSTPTATAAPSVRSPPLEAASLSLSAFCDLLLGVSPVLPPSVAPPSEAWATAVTVFSVSAATRRLPACTSALPRMDASVLPVTTDRPSVAPELAPPPSGVPSAMAMPRVRLSATSCRAPVTSSWAVPPTRTAASLTTTTVTTAASVLVSLLPASAASEATACTCERAVTVMAAPAVMSAPSPISTSAEASAPITANWKALMPRLSLLSVRSVMALSVTLWVALSVPLMSRSALAKARKSSSRPRSGGRPVPTRSTSSSMFSALRLTEPGTLMSASVRTQMPKSTSAVPDRMNWSPSRSCQPPVNSMLSVSPAPSRGSRWVSKLLRLRVMLSCRPACTTAPPRAAMRMLGSPALKLALQGLKPRLMPPVWVSRILMSPPSL